MAGELFLTGITGTGFDAGAVVQQIMQIKSIPLQRLQQEKTQLQARLTSLGNLSGAIGDFLSLFENLDLDKIFRGKKAEVSNPDVLSATVTGDAPTVEFSVTVNRLAQTEIRVSNGGVSDLSATFGSSGTLTITYNTGTSTETFSVDYTAGQTLEDLVNAINSAQDRVRASVYYDGTAYRLMLSERGVENSTVETDTASGVYAIEVSGLPSELGTGLDTLQPARNAEIVIGSGSPITSPSNTFENVITGITLTVKTTGSATVTVTEDYSGVTGFLEEFVSNYNGIVELVDSLTRGEEALFAGENLITGVKFGMAERLEPLIELGVLNYSGDTGKISVDTDRLKDLLSTDPGRVKRALGDLRSAFTPFLEVQKDTFRSFENTYRDRIDRIEDRINQLARRLAQEELVLRREYSRLEAFIAQAQELRERLRQFMITLSEMTGGERS
ncbi:MAG: flagellar filament capping protein FliD [Aquificota bacterium]|nr:flagellar filament capping protein FliD [Aquificota bacterium]